MTSLLVGISTEKVIPPLRGWRYRFHNSHCSYKYMDSLRVSTRNTQLNKIRCREHWSVERVFYRKHSSINFKTYVSKLLVILRLDMNLLTYSSFVWSLKTFDELIKTKIRLNYSEFMSPWLLGNWSKTIFCSVYKKYLTLKVTSGHQVTESVPKPEVRSLLFKIPILIQSLFSRRKRGRPTVDRRHSSWRRNPTADRQYSVFGASKSTFLVNRIPVSSGSWFHAPNPLQFVQVPKIWSK